MPVNCQVQILVDVQVMTDATLHIRPVYGGECHIGAKEDVVSEQQAIYPEGNLTLPPSSSMTITHIVEVGSAA